MIAFVNAKINIGLQVVRRRDDGYHDLETIFYPAGLLAGTPVNPVSFCDILEIVPSKNHSQQFQLHLSGNRVDCPLEKNLVYKAAKLYFDRFPVDEDTVDINLEKYLPDGAGMGGGSADAAFTLRLLNELFDKCTDEELSRMALELGADCPFFIYNRPAYATGRGEILQPINLDLSGKWLVVVKPTVSISTKEAFAGVTPKIPDFDLRNIVNISIDEWKERVVNDFETSFFKKYPLLKNIKEDLYIAGALYASLTGSGSCFYGIYDNRLLAEEALNIFRPNPTIDRTYLLFL